MKISTGYRGGYFYFNNIRVNKLGFLGHIKGFDGSLVEKPLKDALEKIQLNELENRKKILLRELEDINNKLNKSGRTK